MTDPNPPKIGSIMLIDDEEVDQMLYRRLVDRSDHVDGILSFLSGQKALVHLDDGLTPLPDLILLDINMPKMDGFQFLDALLEKFGPDVAPMVIMLTTSIDPADEARARTSPLVHGFKSKPLTDSMLKEFRDMLVKDQSRVA